MSALAKLTKQQQQQLTIAAVATLAVAGLTYLLFASGSKSKGKAGKSGKREDSKGSRTIDVKDSANSELHKKIEEWDKKGKELFKNKQVRERTVGMLSVVFCLLDLLSLISS